MPGQVGASDHQLRHLGPPALRAFFQIAKAWSLTDLEQMSVLGITQESVLRAWREGHLHGLRDETLGLPRNPSRRCSGT